MINRNSKQVSLSSAFVQVNQDISQISFATTLENFPSSTKTELVACILVLMVVPDHSRLTIYTDCQQIINEFSLLSSLIRYPRKLLKFTSYPLWTVLFKILRYNDLDLQLVKVQGHSGNQFNDLVDQCAKTASSL